VAQPAANVLYAQPIIIPDAATYTGIAIQVTTAASGSARLGIYSDANGLPDSLILDAGTVSLTTAGAKEIAISQFLSPAWYWLAFVSNTGAAVYSGYSASGSVPWLGVATPTNKTTNYTFFRVSFTYGPLPATFPSGGVIDGATDATSGPVNTGNIKIMLKL
jgi:hypothetical protein